MTAPLAIIMAGGTGGHVFPALALADELRARGWRIHWLGGSQGIERGRFQPPVIRWMSWALKDCAAVASWRV